MPFSCLIACLESLTRDMIYYIYRYRTVEILKNPDFLYTELRIETRLIRTGRSSSSRIYAATNKKSRLAVFMRVYSGFSKK